MTVTFTFDLEDHRSSPDQERRYPRMTERVLDFLKEEGVVGTFFVVGKVAEEVPDLVRRVVAEGHEIGFHSYAHVPLDKDTVGGFREETRRGKAFLENLTGAAVTGYRAPVCSLVRSTVWATEELTAAGFTYSSSVMPAPNPLYGFPEMPRVPFRWPSGLLEIPLPVARVGPFAIPFLGGIYLRYVPAAMTRALIRRTETPGLWTYCHPYDFDHDEAYFRIRDSSTWASVLLWLNRRRTFAKMRRLFGLGVAKPLASRISEGEFDGAKTVAIGPSPSAALAE